MNSWICNRLRLFVTFLGSWKRVLIPFFFFHIGFAGSVSDERKKGRVATLVWVLGISAIYHLSPTLRRDGLRFDLLQKIFCISIVFTHIYIRLNPSCVVFITL